VLVSIDSLKNISLLGHEYKEVGGRSPQLEAMKSIAFSSFFGSVRVCYLAVVLISCISVTYAGSLVLQLEVHQPARLVTIEKVVFLSKKKLVHLYCLFRLWLWNYASRYRDLQNWRAFANSP
jgi:hypothetical protein